MKEDFKFELVRNVEKGNLHLVHTTAALLDNPNGVRGIREAIESVDGVEMVHNYRRYSFVFESGALFNVLEVYKSIVDVIRRKCLVKK